MSEAQKNRIKQGQKLSQSKQSINKQIVNHSKKPAIISPFRLLPYKSLNNQIPVLNPSGNYRLIKEIPKFIYKRSIYNYLLL
jgi:hypothetical protein